MITVNLMNPQSLPSIWQELEPFLQQCADASNEIEEASEYYHQLVTGFTGLFLVTDEEEILGVILIQRQEYPHVSICQIIALAGKEMGKWLTYANDAVYNWAAVNDCQLVQAYGRPGWKKFYREQGWNMSKVIYSKPVIENTH